MTRKNRPHYELTSLCLRWGHLARQDLRGTLRQQQISSLPHSTFVALAIITRPQAPSRGMSQVHVIGSSEEVTRNWTFSRFLRRISCKYFAPHKLLCSLLKFVMPVTAETVDGTERRLKFYFQKYKRNIKSVIINWICYIKRQCYERYLRQICKNL